ncbi:hypothetical protein L226DRAFT_245213 [Lentinus tigrinus ALCF2SS1-7]|uniref:Uncharacterized protein n=1 Tax=Lentinus tigrinus ALCF2SS1-6 TaxID=1328759 RepID=A0A5C2SQG0_9APHY|nr:hypothetical protein L227DRAFT_208429 [Lentinus tigrinus ALCF2SS1-6]RPD79260.1 hypothetical protein L226DRAFT_245213 [Lentinus tigrinus ALCF2SS1-7]
MPDSDTSSSTDRRSVSRGREAFSSGRGGIGNIRRPSLDSASPSRPPAEPISPVRGREAAVDPDRARTTGRGGMGNIRSGSQARSASIIPENYPQTASLVSDHAASVAEYERSVVQQSEQNARARSSGRGGLGNIKSNSKSRSRSRAAIHSTGRGGAGNLQGGNVEPDLLAELEEDERLRYLRDEVIHSTGRGGRANMSSMHSPPPEPASPHAHDFEATGRGGVGNIVRSRSGSREPRSRSASRGPNGRGSSLARMLNKVGIHGRHEDGEVPPGMTSVTEDGESSVSSVHAQE